MLERLTDATSTFFQSGKVLLEGNRQFLAALTTKMRWPYPCDSTGSMSVYANRILSNRVYTYLQGHHIIQPHTHTKDPAKCY